MVQDRIVTFNTAKKLKELGYNNLCNNCNKINDIGYNVI